MVDCDRCRNNDEMCFECEHADHDFDDYYEPMSDEELQSAEEKRRMEALEKITHDVLQVDGIQGVLPLYQLAHRYTVKPYEDYRKVLACVHTTETLLVASDTLRLIEIRCDNIPVELQNKRILKMLETGEVWVMTEPGESPLENNRHKNVMGLDGYQVLEKTSAEFKKHITVYVGTKSPYDDREYVNYHFEDMVITLNKQYSEDAWRLFGDDEPVKVFYKSPLKQVVITNGQITMLLLPVDARRMS